MFLNCMPLPIKVLKNCEDYYSYYTKNVRFIRIEKLTTF